MENKTFQIDANILDKKKKTKLMNKRTNNPKKSKKGISFIIVCLILAGTVFGIINHNYSVIKDFNEGKIVVCKDRLVSKEYGYVLNKNENAFINKKDGLYFTTYYCFDFDK